MISMTFTIEKISNSLDDYNILRLITILKQLSNVGTNDIPKIRNHINQLYETENTICKKIMVVVKYNDKVIGTGSIIIEEKIIHNIGKVGHIEDIVIDSEYRRFGLASKVLEYLKKIAKENECYKIILAASDNVTPFYEKNGYRKSGNVLRCDL